MSRWRTWPALADLTRFWCSNCHNGGLDPPWRTSLGDLWANVQGIVEMCLAGGQKNDTFRKKGVLLAPGRQTTYASPTTFNVGRIALAVLHCLAGGEDTFLEKVSFWRGGDLTRLAMLATRQSHSLCSITPRHGVPTEDNYVVMF